MDPIEVPLELCGHHVPGIWRYLVPEEVKDFRLPKERRSTCNNCPMACFQGYDPTHRCCAYHPLVPNFLLGLSLRNKQSRKAVEGLLERGYLTPEGYQRTPVQWIDYLADLSEDVSERVKCPILDDKTGLCNIYAFRNAVCSTFFCLNDHGPAGQEFWQALEEMVSHTEACLSQWALEQAGFDVRGYYAKLEGLTKNILVVTDPETRGWALWVRKELWGSWFGKELELYEKAAQIISDNRDRLREIAGKWELLEAKTFERAQVKMVPEAYRDEIDPADLEDDDDDEESADLKELWDDVKKAHRKMWHVPPKLVLNKRAHIVRNPLNDKESKAFRKFPYVVEYLTKSGKEHEWREFITKETAEALKLFKRPRPTDGKTQKKLDHFPEPDVFLAEWHGKKILRKPV